MTTTTTAPGLKVTSVDTTTTAPGLKVTSVDTTDSTILDAINSNAKECRDQHKLPSYGKIYNVGHPYTQDLYDQKCYIQEKLDGSQFSFGINDDGELLCRSKNRAIDVTSYEKMFNLAVHTANRLYQEDKLKMGWIYRAEAITQPKHNSINYKVIPPGGLVIYEIQTDKHSCLHPDQSKEVAESLGLLFAPVYYKGMVSTKEIAECCKKTSVVNPEIQIEGVVIKRLIIQKINQFDELSRSKYVNEEFRELHLNNPEYKKTNKESIVDNISNTFSTKERWKKVIQHMKEDGVLLGEPKDIGNICKYVQEDIFKECEPMIKDMMYALYKKDIKRAVVKGIPEWYKKHLAGMDNEDKPTNQTNETTDN